MHDCILFAEDGSVKLMQVKDDQRAININVPDSFSYIGYDIKRFIDMEGDDAAVYLIASTSVVNYEAGLAAIYELKPKPYETLSKE